MTTTVTRTRRSNKADSRTRASQFRPDIEGLRAIAVLFVLVWHAGISWLPGGFVGVDVFFVVSGFLMTSILHREMVNKSTVSVKNFYARRARRLIPASLATLVFTGIATYLILPQTRWWDIGLDIASAGSYIVNWRLAERSVDYLSENSAPSPVQHFWSLSVEEQFYIFWPILIIAIAWMVKKIHGNATRWVFGALSIIAIGSLAWSVYLTNSDPGRAYFVSTTRLWELALGGLVALSIPLAAKLPTAAAAAMSWLGVVGILGTGLLLTTAVPFPGFIALIPTVSTALVLASGPAAGTAGPVRIFSNRTIQWIGGCSYSMYLWHWPVLVIGGYFITDGLRETTVTEGITLVALSILPAWLSLKMIENPVRDAARIKDSVKNSLYLAFFGIAACLIVGMILSLAGPRPATGTYVSQYARAGNSMTDAKLMGAEVLAPLPRDDANGAPVESVAEMVPSPAQIRTDYDRCPVSRIDSAEVVACELGNRTSPKRIVLVGDSHAQQWIPSLTLLADRENWSLTAYIHDACPFKSGTVLRDGKPYVDCMTWNREISDRLLAGPMPTMLLTSSMGTGTDGSGSNAIAAALQPFADKGAKVVLIRDTPKPGIDQGECISANLKQLTKCARPRSETSDALGREQIAASQAVGGSVLVDLNDAICPTDQCAAVIGGVAVYRDSNHITSTYARTLSSRLLEQLPQI